jgi:hypothetical protein
MNDEFPKFEGGGDDLLAEGRRIVNRQLAVGTVCQ